MENGEYYWVKLKDRFAMAALARVGDDVANRAEIANEAYDLADDMLQARKSK